MDEKWLNRIHSPADIKGLSEQQLTEVAAEIREKMIQTVSQTGGHLASNLGVVELTLALHMSFDCPHDQIVWDVGHQCYTHKLLTGRADAFDTLRQENGITGFPNPKESPYDSFITGHSSTSISVANGLAKAKALRGDDGHVVAVIGDGAMTGGLAFEGLSNAGRSHDRLIVVLNDNQMSIDHNVGFIARHLSNLRSTKGYIQFKKSFGSGLRRIPLIGNFLYRLLFRAKMRIKTTLYSKSSLFEDMGFYYLGPVDGHNLHDLTQAMEAAKSITSGPVLLHVETIKGQGYRYAVAKPNQFHGIGSFDVETGKAPDAAPCFSGTFGQCIEELADNDQRICLITAAMTGGTGLTVMAEKYPKRCFDVGIAEEHAVTFSAGLASGGMLPVFAVYSSFLQRCYDQLLNDAAINGQHIVLAIDRSGIVPDDGETHQGIFDVPLLNTIPGVTIYAPATFAEMPVYLRQALYDVDGIAVVRYPKGGELPMPVAYEPDYQPYTWFRSRAARVLLVTYGRLFSNVMTAAKQLADRYRHVTVLKLNRIKPLDPDCIQIAMKYQRVIFFEEGSRRGGVGEYFGDLLSEARFAREYEIHAIDQFVPACKVPAGLRMVGLDVESMVMAVAGPDRRPASVKEEAEAGERDAAAEPEESPAVEQPTAAKEDKAEEPSVSDVAGEPSHE